MVAVRPFCLNGRQSEDHGSQGTPLKTSPPPPIHKKKVLIVDDHAILREGLRSVINQQPDLEICGEADTVAAGLFAVAQGHPDVVIVDLSLGEGSGLELIKDIHAQKPALPILVLTMHREEIYAARAIHAGASGFVMKNQPVGIVLDALRTLRASPLAASASPGRRQANRPAAQKIPVASTPLELLNDRELEIFRSFGRGCSLRHIAARLRIGIRTVATHRASIIKKLGLKNATELVSAAARFVAARERS
jgi:DNA-binding NarL/FixJ family response regulator